MGERLAYFFGITSPKYACEINAYNRKLKEEEDRKRRQEQSFSGWRQETKAANEGHQMHQLDPISVESLSVLPPVLSTPTAIPM